MRYSLILLSLLIVNMAIAQNAVTLTITTDDYGDETSWEVINLDIMTVVQSGQNYNNNQLYTFEMNLIDGNYQFIIYDDYGDGICCQFGNGYYELVYDLTSEVIASGGSFGDSESTDFVLPYVAPPSGCTDPDAINFDPNATVDNGTCIYQEGIPVMGLDILTGGFNEPLIIANSEDDRLFIGEKTGRIKIINGDGTVEASPFLNISNLVGDGGERGLLGLAFHPDYGNNGYFYVHYTRTNGNSRVARYQVSGNPNIADGNSSFTILDVNQPFSNHNGGHLMFGPDGYLYIGYGDGGSQGDPNSNAQNPMALLGKMLRIDVDSASPYGIPASNPFVQDNSVRDEIWAIGMRNPWRYSFDRLTGDFWIGDVGDENFEEIDFEPANDPGGHNYGWRCYEANSPFNTNGCPGVGNFTFPVAAYPHSAGACSVTGGFVYRGEEFPSLYGLYIYTDYCNGIFWGLRDDGNGGFDEFELLNQASFGWSTFGENAAGELFVANLENGNIYQIVDPCLNLTTTLVQDGFYLLAEEGTNYAWFLNGEFIAGENSMLFHPTEVGTYYVVVFNDQGCAVASNEVVVTTTVIEDIERNGIKLYPNPASSDLNISIFSTFSQDALISIYNGTGKIIKSQSMKLGEGDQQFKIDVIDLNSGTYLFEIFSENMRMTRSFVIK